MIRKAIIVVLTLAAVWVAIMWVASVGQVWIWSSSATETESGVGVGVGVGDGRVMLLAYSPSEVTYGSQIDYSSPPAPVFHVERPANFGRGSLAIHFPMWAPLILFAAYPTIAFIRGPLRRWRRRRKNLCIKCAYDLTGNESDVCPECGEAV